MNFPRISIVIPSYNQGQFLEETILSVLNQQYPNLELFVVDGGSNDNSIDIIRKYEQYITWWVSEKDKGQSEAINKGFKKATGEIVGWLCSDDLYTPGTLMKVAAEFSTASFQTGLIHGGTVLFNARKEVEKRFNYLNPCIESYVSGIVFSQPSTFYKKKYLDQVGYVDESFHYGMDFDLFMRLSLVSLFIPSNDVFSRYRLHEQSKSVSESNKFISDWKKSFVNMCKNISWEKELEFLESTGLYNSEIDFYRPFSFEPDTAIVSSINRNKALYFHLGHVLKDLYWTSQFEKAAKLNDLMKKPFPKDWKKEDIRLNSVILKLSMPRIVLRILKKVKHVF